MSEYIYTDAEGNETELSTDQVVDMAAAWVGLNDHIDVPELITQLAELSETKPTLEEAIDDFFDEGRSNE